jgi:PHD/YefM family antitoxin component YafN of YafNO toxin-antitoxin module
MPAKAARFVVDDHGNRTAVLLDMDRYRELLEGIEELESIRAYDAVKAAREEAIPLAQALAEIEAARQ